MWAFLTTLVLLGLALLWLRVWLRHSRFAQGVVLGVILAIPAHMLVSKLVNLPHLPIWLPALPFALIAISLFGFGLLAWAWTDD
jgi:hypothetical protein